MRDTAHNVSNDMKQALQTVTRRRWWQRRSVRTATGVLAVSLAAGAYWFAPWTLFSSTTVADAAPAAAVVVAEGTFVSQEHPTTGKVQLLALADGSHVVRLQGLHTSEGPKVVVVISDAAVPADSKNVDVFEDGRFADLGALKGNLGDANYPVPPEVTVDGFRSVSVWCDRFAVSFGAAALTPEHNLDKAE